MTRVVSFHVEVVIFFNKTQQNDSGDFATSVFGPADPLRMTIYEPSDWTAGGLDKDWWILKMSPLNTRQQH